MTKKFFTIAALGLLLAAPLTTQAQSDVQDFKSHGIHVILRSTKANQVVSAVLGFEGGLAYGETMNPVTSGMTAAVITKSGSQKYPKAQYRDMLARLSTTIAGSGSLYHMTYTLQTIKPSFNQAWDMFSSVIAHPLYDTLEASKISESTIKSIESRESEPESYASFLADSIWKDGSKLNREARTGDVESLSTHDLQAYRDQQMQRSRAVLVIVGDVSRADLEAKLATFDALPQGNFSWPKVEHINPGMDQFKFVAKPADFPTTYVDMRGPSACLSDAEWWPERILVEMLNKRFFEEIRTKRNLSYAPGIYPNGDYSNFATNISFQSVDPDSATHVALRELRKVQTELIPANELKNAKEGRITTYYYGTQQNLRQANALYNDQVEYGDWKLFFQIVPQTEKVTAEQVKAAANKYLHHLTFVVLGPEGKSNRDVYHFE